MVPAKHWLSLEGQLEDTQRYLFFSRRRPAKPLLLAAVKLAVKDQLSSIVVTAPKKLLCSMSIDVRARLEGPLNKSHYCLFLVVLLLRGVSVAAVLDQSLGPVLNSVGQDINDCCALVAQTYTAGVTGTLAAVSVDVQRIGFMDPLPLQVSIYDTVNGLPGATVLGQTLSNSFSFSDLITFSTAIPQVAGVQYAIVVDFSGAPTPPHDEGIWAGEGNLYAGGGSAEFCLAQTCGPGTIGWQSTGEFDSHFKTFVNPVPEPASIFEMLAGGLGVLMVAVRRTRMPLLTR